MRQTRKHRLVAELADIFDLHLVQDAERVYALELVLEEESDMPIEKERKFLIDTSKLPLLGVSTYIKQGYLSFSPAVRVRAMRQNALLHYFLTVKTPTGIEGESEETEAPIRDDIGRTLMAICEDRGDVLEKERFIIGWWEIDHFDNGLWLAEYEESRSQCPPLESLPVWVTEEVTGVQDYSNAYMAKGRTLR